jgi:hypothetical protein
MKFLSLYFISILLSLTFASVIKRTSHDNSCSGGCYLPGSECIEGNQKGAGEKTTDECYHTMSGTYYGCLINKKCVCYELNKKTIKAKQGRGYCFK